MFGMIDPQLKCTQEEMYKFQEARRLNWNDAYLAEKEKEATTEYCRLLGLEENLLKEKSRVQWLELGGGNNSFFHRSLMVRMIG